LDAVTLDGMVEWIKTLQFEFQISRSGGTTASRRLPSHGLFPGPSNYFVALNPVDGGLTAAGPGHGGNDTIVEAINELLARKLFLLNAQRYSLGRVGVGRAERLAANAGNLPQVLSFLQGERRGVFRKLVGHLREVFSTVGDLSVVGTASNELEIRVWPTEDIDPSEVSFSLENCGTGVAQVIAILTVMMTSEDAVIVIDEISSFLHPSATKALLRIMQSQYSQHQYIVSTHSPEVISGGNPASVHLVRRDGYESSVKPVDLGKLDQLREVANQIGVSMTDVFAADRLVWVEGPTEEMCFPFIYNETVGPLPRGLIVTPVVATGDFFSKTNRRELVFDIYNRLSNAASPLVKSVTFSFDRETLGPNQVRDLEKRASGRLLLLPRRHFECFLVDPPAITAFILSHVPSLAATLTPAAVSSSLQAIGGDQKFKASANWNGNIADVGWLAEVDAAGLIKHICAELTDQRLEFTKTRHSFELLQHIMANNRQSLKDLIDYVGKLVALAQS
jgi:hypothetical protein